MLSRAHVRKDTGTGNNKSSCKNHQRIKVTITSVFILTPVMSDCNYLCIRVYVHEYVHMYVCMYVCVCVCTRLYVRTAYNCDNLLERGSKPYDKSVSFVLDRSSQSVISAFSEDMVNKSFFMRTLAGIYRGEDKQVTRMCNSNRRWEGVVRGGGRCTLILASGQ